MSHSMPLTTNYSRLARTMIADPCRPCSVCGGLECLCRPRFFAGQLLTEDDLNRLDHYIVEKNKLHNRYIHGWGVACGLEVLCHPCGNYVLVEPGYALSGCGDDIIVCREETVDICKLIGECCSPPPDECQPPRPRPAGCDDLEQQWILAICYRETPSRGITSLKSPVQCSCGCACGSSSCTCGSKSKSSRTSPATKTPAQCEPTVLCEGYYFKVYSAPRQAKVERPPGASVPATPSQNGAMLDRVTACLRELYAAIPPIPSANATLNQIRQWCCDIRDNILELLAHHPGTNCRIAEMLNNLCPAPQADTPPAAYLNEVAQRLLPILVQYARDCICSAFLPPCLESVTDPCVPLATVTTQGRECRILRVCNLEGRKFLTTFPNLQYWLSWLPYTRRLRELLDRLCCRAADIVTRGVTPGVSTYQPSAHFSQSQQIANVTGAFTNSFARARQRSTVESIALDALHLADAEGQPFLSPAQAVSPLAAVIADEFAQPFVSEALPEGLGALLGAAGGLDVARMAEEAKRRDAEVAALRAQVDQLQVTARTQQVTIDGLIGRLRREG